MFKYYMMLRLRYNLPVKPIVVYLSPGAGGLVREQYIDRIFDEEVNVLYYNAIGLPDLQADDYQELENPLGPGLSALMKTSKLGRVAHKFQSLRAMARSHIDPARKALLNNVVETYLTLNDAEKSELQEIIGTPEGEEVRTMISVYEQRGIDKGIEKGREEGIETGVVRGKRDTLLRLMRRKFRRVSRAD